MNKLIDISKNGFRVCESRENELDIAFISLRLALKAYFSTYRDLKLNLSSLNNNIFNIEDVDKNYSLSYYESCTETIVHFQHFFELACKHILKNEHPLLADVASKKAVVLSKLLKGEILNEIEDKEGANKQVISSQADSLIKISRIWADFFPANTSNQPI